MKHMSAVFFSEARVALSPAQIEELKTRARNEPARRARLCLHPKPEAHFQDMLIALCRDSYVRPKRQGDRLKSYHLIEGRMLVVFYDEAGGIVERLRFDRRREDCPLVFRFNCNVWHSVFPLSEIAVFREIIEGAFRANEYAPWSPDGKNTDEVQKLMEAARA